MGKRGASEAGLKDQDDGMMTGNALAGGDINRRALFVHNLRAVNDQFSKEFGVQSYLKHLKKIEFGIPGGGLAPSGLGAPASAGAAPQDDDENPSADNPEPTSVCYVDKEAVWKEPVAATEKKEPEEDILFETRSQLMILTDKQWKSGGVGQLTLRKPKGDPSAKAHLVMTTTVGRVMLNASLYKGMTFNRPKPEKVQTLLMAFEDGQHTRKTGMFRFKTGDVA
eukprot:gene13922-16458_t